MNVCFLVGTLGRGGAERQLIYMLRALELEGIGTRVLCLTEGEPLEAEVRSMGVEVKGIRPSPNKLLRAFEVIKSLRRRPADVIQSSHFYGNTYAGIAGRALNVPSIGAIRSDLSFELLVNGFSGKLHLKLPHHLIANSRKALQRAVQSGADPDRVHLVRNVVEGPRLPRVAATRSNNNVNVVFVGRLTPEKRPELFIQLAHQLSEALPDSCLTFQVVGDGPGRSEVEKLAQRSRNSNHKIIFCGEQSNMSDIYGRADILVLTSIHEGTPNVILEAQAHGVPVVATNVGGVADVLTEGAGIIVEPMDFPQLLRSTISLVEDPQLRRRMGEHGRRHVGEQYSLKDLQTRLVEIYSVLAPEKMGK